MLRKTFPLTLSLLLGATTAFASTDNMAQSLMKMRAEVESLYSQINDEKDAYKSQMRSLTAQRSELEGMISRKDLKIQELQKELDSVRKKIADASKNTKGLEPIVTQSAQALKAYIKTSIPFKTQDRLASVEKIQNDLKSKLITPQKALSLVFNSYSDEIRMTKENAIFKQTINLDGQEKLASVAKVGTTMLFFQTPNGKVGYVEKTPNGWHYKEELDKEKQKEIANLFDSFKKQIRSGYFTLPNALIVSEDK